MTRLASQQFFGTGDARGAIARVTDCGCSLAQYEWRYAQQYRAQIDQHWQEASAATPKYFDGIVLLTSVCHFEMLDTQRSRIELTLFETRFRNFLFWRHHGFTGDGACGRETSTKARSISLAASSTVAICMGRAGST